MDAKAKAYLKRAIDGDDEAAVTALRKLFPPRTQ